MTKQLVRGNNIPATSEVLSTSEFMNVALEQIASTALSLKDSDEAENVINGMSDIMELMYEFLKSKNIDNEYFFAHAVELRNTQGAFDKKVAVLKD